MSDGSTHTNTQLHQGLWDFIGVAHGLLPKVSLPGLPLLSIAIVRVLPASGVQADFRAFESSLIKGGFTKGKNIVGEGAKKTQ